MPPIVIALLLAGLLLAALAAVRWHRTLVMLLPALVVLNGLPLRVGASQLRLDQLATCLLLLPIGAAVLAGRRVLRVDATTGWIVAVLAINVLASALNSPARTYSLAQCANLASAWAIYVLLLNTIDTPADLEAFLRAFLGAAAAAFAIAIAAFVLAVSGEPLGGAEVSRAAAESLTRAFGAYGTMVEPNILGSFSAAVLVMTVAFSSVGTEYRVSTTMPLVRLTGVLAAVALVLSFTRSAWVGVAAGLAFAAYAGRGVVSLPMRRLGGIGIVLAAAVVAVLLVPGSAADFLAFKFQNLFNLSSRTGVFRLLTYTLAIEQTAQHPIVGWGTYSFAALVAQGSDFMQYEGWRNLWIGNYLLLALHDTGVVGLALWIGLLWSVVRGAVRVVRSSSPMAPGLTASALACVAGVVTLLIPFLATTGFSLGYTWVLIGLAGCHVRLDREARWAPVPSRDPALMGLLPADAT